MNNNFTVNDNLTGRMDLMADAADEITPFPQAAVSALPMGSKLTTATVCDILEHFGQHLQKCEQAGEQIRLILSSLHDALEADLVIWHPGTSADSIHQVGKQQAPLFWCEEFMRHVLEDAPRDQNELLLSFADGANKPCLPWPCSAAMIRLSRSRQIWITALSFHPRRAFDQADLKVMRLTRRMLINHRQQEQVYDRLRESLFGLVRCLTAAIDAKDPYTWGHSERVGRIAVRLAKQMGLPGPFQSDLYLGGLLHDIGKIGIRDSVLQKPDALTDEEFAHIKEHPLIGDRLVSNIQTLQHLRPAIRSHHERYDGTGYPDGLAGEDIPLMARILAVSDGCDAMMAARPYRTPLPPEQIDLIMKRGAGTQWDPQIIEHFLTCNQEVYSICQRGLGDSVFAAVERALRADQGVEGSSLVSSH